MYCRKMVWFLWALSRPLWFFWWVDQLV